MENCIEIKNLSKTFKTNNNLEVNALKNITLEIKENDFICIVGPSGCGKSTMLRIIASLENASEGIITYKGKEITAPTSDIGMVFQNYSLYPHMTVKENILFPLKVKKMKKKDKEEVLKPIVSLLKLENLLNRKPNQLSGGQQQRVAIGRALIKKPSILLMDEPFSNLE